MRHVRILTAALLLTAVACQHEATLPDATGAARDIYLQYADREGLTVAMIGGYKNGTDTFNAVALQAQDEAAWLHLREEFGLEVEIPALPVNAKARQMIVTSYQADSTPQSIEAIIDSVLGMLPVGKDVKVSAHVDTLYEDDASPLATLAGKHSRLMAVAAADGKTGYVVSADDNERTLWLFFYASRQEMERIFEILTPKDNIQ